METEPLVRSARPEDGIVVLTLDRPERRNALTSEAAGAVADAVSEHSTERVIVLTGAGRAFCAGGDLDELERWSTASQEEIGSKLYGTFQQMIRAIRAADAIVIAAVNGAAVGAGMDLAQACDLRIASTQARFGQVWVGLGVIPGTGGAYLTQALVGRTRAAQMLLTGKLIDAETAFEWGLVNAVVGPDDLLDEALRWARTILGHPPEGVVANKRAIVAADDAAVSAALEHAGAVQPGRFTSEEFRTAVAAAKLRSSR